MDFTIRGRKNHPKIQYVPKDCLAGAILFDLTASGAAMTASEFARFKANQIGFFRQTRAPATYLIRTL